MARCVQRSAMPFDGSRFHRIEGRGQSRLRWRTIGGAAFGLLVLTVNCSLTSDLGGLTGGKTQAAGGATASSTSTSEDTNSASTSTTSTAAVTGSASASNSVSGASTVEGIDLQLQRHRGVLPGRAGPRTCRGRGSRLRHRPRWECSVLGPLLSRGFGERHRRLGKLESHPRTSSPPFDPGPPDRRGEIRRPASSSPTSLCGAGARTTPGSWGSGDDSTPVTVTGLGSPVDDVILGRTSDARSSPIKRSSAGEATDRIARGRHPGGPPPAGIPDSALRRPPDRWAARHPDRLRAPRGQERPLLGKWDHHAHRDRFLGGSGRHRRRFARAERSLRARRLCHSVVGVPSGGAPFTTATAYQTLPSGVTVTQMAVSDVFCALLSDGSVGCATFSSDAFSPACSLASRVSARTPVRW